LFGVPRRAMLMKIIVRSTLECGRSSYRLSSATDAFAV
jgi:hypothetical protein